MRLSLAFDLQRLANAQRAVLAVHAVAEVAGTGKLVCGKNIFLEDQASPS